MISTPSAASPLQPTVVLIGGGTFLLLTVLTGTSGWQMLIFLGLGALLGIVLYHAAFGFTAAYRRLIVDRDATANRAQIVMLGLATLLFTPTLAGGQGIDTEAYDANAPLGKQVAFLFGLGMQIVNGCGSGTRFTFEGGSTRMIITLVFFCAGSFWGSLDMLWWNQTPRLDAIVLSEHFGWTLGAGVQLFFLACLWWVLGHWRPRKPVRRLFPLHGDITREWPFHWGAVALAVLSWISLLITGHAWSITWAFSLWSPNAAQILGCSAEGVWFWTGSYQEFALKHSILEHTVPVMNLGVILGAVIVSGLADRFAPTTQLPWRMLAAAVINGFLVGYGTRIAFGCNTGAFFSGVASTSLHGSLWIATALAGTWIGTRLRPWFGLSKS